MAEFTLFCLVQIKFVPVHGFALIMLEHFFVFTSKVFFCIKPEQTTDVNCSLHQNQYKVQSPSMKPEHGPKMEKNPYPGYISQPIGVAIDEEVV